MNVVLRKNKNEELQDSFNNDIFLRTNRKYIAENRINDYKQTFQMFNFQVEKSTKLDFMKRMKIVEIKYQTIVIKTFK